MRVRTPALVVAGALVAGLGGAAVWSVWPSPPPPTLATQPDPAEPEEPPAPTSPDRKRFSYDPPLTDEDREASRVIVAELKASVVWDHEAVLRVRAALGERKLLTSIPTWELAGLSRAAARRLSIVFGGSQARFDVRLGDRLLLFPSFVKNEAGEWELTQTTEDNLRLPFHPRAPWTLEATSAKDGARGQYENCEAVGRHRFMSGTFTKALRCTFRFREHRFRITTGTELLHDDWSFADRLDHALAVVPAEHLAFVNDISVDPGTHPRHYNAQTSSDGTAIHLYLSGAGKKVPQAELDQTTAHEIGHVISLQQDGAFCDRWDAAILRDGFGVSSYGLTNRWEDFAETYVLYLASGPLRSTYGARTPARFAEMSALFEIIRRGVK